MHRRLSVLVAGLVFALSLGPVFPGAVGAASILLVPTQYPTIQAAVDAAAPGDTIVISPGVYFEQVSVGKSVTIVGVGALRTTIHAPTVLRPGTHGRANIVEINGGARVTMARLSISGPGPNPCGAGSLFGGIEVIQGASLDLGHARVLDIHDTPIHDCSHTGTAVRVGSFIDGETGSATIHDVVISRYQNDAVGVFQPGSVATVSDSVLDAGIGPSDVVLTFGIEVGAGAVAKVTHNVIRGNRCNGADLGCGSDPMTTGQGAGIGNGPGDPPGPGTEFAHNLLVENDIGIYLFAADYCCNVHHNVIARSRFFGIAIQDGSNDVSYDVIVGGPVGVGVIADFRNAQATLHREQIVGVSVAPTQTLQCCGFTASVRIQ